MLCGTVLRSSVVRAICGALSVLMAGSAWAGNPEPSASRESPNAEVSAFYMFRSWDNPDRLVLIMNVAAGQDPESAAETIGFGDDIVYRISIDNDLNGVANDVIYEFRFSTENRRTASGYPWPYVGNPYAPEPGLRGITALAGEGSEGLAVRQRYSVTEIRGGVSRALFKHRGLVVVPPNVGTTTMPDYESLAAQGIYHDAKTHVRVFAGPRAETYYGDIGALRDGLTLRRTPPFMSEAEDGDNRHNSFGVNRFRRANVHSIAVEVPIESLTLDGKKPEKTAVPLLGAYASVLRKSSDVTHDDKFHGAARARFKQVSRMGNPSFRTFLVDPATRARWDASRPEHDAQFQDLLKSPGIARLLTSSTGLPASPEPRLELVQIILKYPNQTMSGQNCRVPCADLLRINLRIPPTPAESQQRLGALLSPDPAGLPNGCRPNDDITDITLRAFGGPPYFAARIGDGVNYQDAAPGAGLGDGSGYGRIDGNHLDVTENGIVKEFPFQPTPHSGAATVVTAF